MTEHNLNINKFYADYIKTNLIREDGRLMERMNLTQAAELIGDTTGNDIAAAICAGEYSDFGSCCIKTNKITGKPKDRPSYTIWTRKIIKHITGKDVEEILK